MRLDISGPSHTVHPWEQSHNETSIMRAMDGVNHQLSTGPGQDYFAFGRVDQKQRTHEALRSAAISLMTAGHQPTVAEVAKKAGISKSTAYRYFPSRDLMLAEVLLVSTVAADRETVLLAAQTDGSAAERVDRVIRADHAMVTRHRTAFRTSLRAFLLRLEKFPDAHRGPSNRVRHLTTALAPIANQLSTEHQQRLVAALSLCLGIEAATTTEIACNLTATEAEEVKRWAAAALLGAAMSQSDRPVTTAHETAAGTVEHPSGDRSGTRTASAP